VATHDDRSRTSGGYSDDGFYSTSGVGGGVHHFDDGTRTIDGDAFGKDTKGFDASGYTPIADLEDKPASHHDTFEDEDERKQFGWSASADIGLLVLRLALGGAFVMHGLQKVFGLFGGPGIDGQGMPPQGAQVFQVVSPAYASSLKVSRVPATLVVCGAVAGQLGEIAMLGKPERVHSREPPSPDAVKKARPCAAATRNFVSKAAAVSGSTWKSHAPQLCETTSAASSATTRAIASSMSAKLACAPQ
jgi:hypothetical protein